MSELFTSDTIGVFLEKTAEKYPNNEFIVFSEVRWSFSVFNERVDRLARGLLHIGITPGDHVGIWANNIPDWLTFFFALAKIGAVLVPLNTSFKRHDAEYVIADSDMKALALVDRFRDSNYREIALELIPEMQETAPGQLQSKCFPKLQTLIHLGSQNYPGMFNTKELLRHGDNVSVQEYRKITESVSCHDVINIQYTSGTTGFPKGVMLTHHNILNNGYYIGERQCFTEKDRLCLPVPLFHCFGISLGVMVALTHATTMVLLEGFDPGKILASVQKEKCTALYGVPAMFIAELNHPKLRQFDLSSLRTGIMAGAPCPRETMRQVMEKMNMKEITIAYGLTESSPVITQTDVNDPIDKQVETIGKKHLHTEVKIIAPETGEELGPNKTGEICCRGYNVMKGYYKKPEATAQIIDAEGWLHTGDLGEVDDEGYYKITGRLKDMIIRGGENIYPREIEEFLFTLEGVQAAQIVGVPDYKRGEIVVAFIIPKEGQSLTESRLRAMMRNDIASYKIPRHFFFVEEFPMTPSGKVQKYKLRKMAMEILEIDGEDDLSLPSQMVDEQSSNTKTKQHGFGKWTKYFATFLAIVAFVFSFPVFFWKHAVRPNLGNLPNLVTCLSYVPYVPYFAEQKQLREQEVLKKFRETREREIDKAAIRMIPEMARVISDYAKIRNEANNERERIASIILSEAGRELDQFPHRDQGDFEFYRDKAELGDAKHQFLIGYCYETGKGVEKNFETAISWYRKAAENGFVEVAWYLGLRYEAGREDGILVSNNGRDIKMAKKWYDLAATQGLQIAVDRLQEIPAPMPAMSEEDVRVQLRAVKLMQDFLKKEGHVEKKEE